MSPKHYKLSRKKEIKLLEYFILEVTARSAADLLGLQPNTTALYYWKIRQLIVDHLATIEHEVFAGPVELDESCIGGARKGKRGPGAAGKVVVFGILKRKGKVYTKIVSDTKSKTLMSVTEGKIAPDSVVYTDSYRNYNALDVSGFHHRRISHSEQFGNGNNDINGIEKFWSQAKRVLRKYSGIPKNTFPLVLRECEFGFNYGTPKQQLKTLKEWAEI